MSDFWIWATVHWWLAFWLMFWAIVGTFRFLQTIFYRLPNRVLRHRNIKARGWPPSHLDADGNFLKKDDSEEPAGAAP